MIEHADTALGDWLAAELDIGAVEFSPPSDETGSSRRKRPALHVFLLGLTELTDRRDNEVRDVRDDDGQVIARQRSIRYFELAYVVTASGDPKSAHGVLGALIQLLVDSEAIPDRHVPSELSDIGVPIELELDAQVSPADGIKLLGVNSGAAVVVKLVVPFRPAAEREIAEPVVELELDMAPPPEPRRPGPAPMGAASPADAALTDRKWKAVRRREYIAAPVGEEGRS